MFFLADLPEPGTLQRKKPASCECEEVCGRFREHVRKVVGFVTGKPDAYFEVLDPVMYVAGLTEEEADHLLSM